jgi:hypothetical protein
MEWLIRCITLLWASVDWQAVAAIGTFLAIIVALIPIWKDARRTQAQARNLRLRFGAKLLLLRPSLANIFLGPGHPSVVQSAVLSPAGFQQVVRELEVMMSQASVVDADEHDELGVTVLNLAVAVPLYGSPAMTAASAKNTLERVDLTMKAFEKHGLLTSEVNEPWSKEGNS